MILCADAAPHFGIGIPAAGNDIRKEQESRCSTARFPKAVSIVLMIGIMRLLINILLFILGAVGSGICAFLLSAALADSGFLGSCFEGNCAYAALFMVLPVTWFVLFALYVMALLIRRRKPFRNGRL